MVEIQLKCQECIHVDVCNIRKQFEELQQRMMQDEVSKSNVFRIDVSCYYFKKEKPVTKTIDLSKWEGD